MITILLALLRTKLYTDHPYVLTITMVLRSIVVRPKKNVVIFQPLNALPTIFACRIMVWIKNNVTNESKTAQIVEFKWSSILKDVPVQAEVQVDVNATNIADILVRRHAIMIPNATGILRQWFALINSLSYQERKWPIARHLLDNLIMIFLYSWVSSFKASKFHLIIRPDIRKVPSISTIVWSWKAKNQSLHINNNRN